MNDLDQLRKDLAEANRKIEDLQAEIQDLQNKLNESNLEKERLLGKLEVVRSDKEARDAMLLEMKANFDEVREFYHKECVRTDKACADAAAFQEFLRQARSANA